MAYVKRVLMMKTMLFKNVDLGCRVDARSLT